MAGIGFELKKLIETRSIRGLLGAAFSGTLIVAGPWLISAASMSAAQSLPILASSAASFEFTGAMVWSFALSICLSAAPLYVFVRLSSDLVYDGKRGETASLLLKFAGLSWLLSLPVGYLAALILSGKQALSLAFALLLGALNALWAATMTVTVIRRYGRILASYALGMAVMYLLARYLGARAGAPGAILALAEGYSLTAVLLLVATVEALGLAPYPRAYKSLRKYAARYRNLAISGLLYALATWIDKAVLAVFEGVAPPSTWLFLNPGYDSAFYYANLALIPGLVYYTISTETEFSLGLKRLVAFLAHRRAPEIEATKRRLVRDTRRGLVRQTAFQGAIALCLALLSPSLGPILGFPPGIFICLVAAGVFQLLFLTAFNMLFYLELYKASALSALAFVLVDLGLSLAMVLTGSSASYKGLPYLAGCVVAAVLATALAFRGLDAFDRIVFLRASGEDYGR